MPNGDCVMSSGSVIANQTNQDLFAEIMAEMTISSNTPSAGANFAIWIAELGEDGTTYGDGVLTAGTQKAYTPPWAPVAVIPVQSVQATTLMVGPPALIAPLPFNSLRIIIQNNTGITLSGTASNNVVKLITAVTAD
jgi:hypothetical protein